MKTKLMTTVATVALAVAISSAGLFALYATRPQEVWREYQRDDLGFRIEMPGEPIINKEVRRPHDYGFHADVLIGSTFFSVQYLEYDTDSEEAVVKNQSIAFSMLAAMNKVKVDKKQINMYGLRGQEFIFPQINGRGLIARHFSLSNKRFVLLDTEGVGVGPDNSSVRRFLDSFVVVPR